MDTTIWSLALRRRRHVLSGEERTLVRELEALVVDGSVVLVGPVRQEILTGVREAAAFERLKAHLSHFDDEPLRTADFVAAAELSNRCLAAGVAPSSTDLLLCAIAVHRGLEIFTTDPDFASYAAWIPVRLHKPRRRESGA